MGQRDDDQHTADQWRYHMTFISDVLEHWREGEISTYEKRRRIADENKRYYGEHVDPWLVRTGRRYDLPAVLADAWGVPEEIMTIALNARRHGGPEAFGDMLATAGVGTARPGWRDA